MLRGPTPVRKSTRQELRKLREIVHDVFDGRPCFFCAAPLLTRAAANHGDSDGPKLLDQLTLHHVDGDHQNNAPANRVWAHRFCHKRHHMQAQHAARRAA